MTRTITRMYASQAAAKRAAQELKDQNFRDVHIFSGEGSTASHEDHVNALTKTMHLKTLARVYAEGLKNGHSLVSAHAPWGSQAEATAILNSHGPIDSGVPSYKVKSIAWDERTPMSSALLAPVLAKNIRPFETLMNVRSQTKSMKHVTSKLGMGLLSKKLLKMGGKHLSANTTPLSSRLGLPLLSKKRYIAMK